MATHLVPHSLLDTSAVPAAERFALFKAGLAVSHDVVAVHKDEPFEARLDAWMIGGMMVTAGHQGPSRIIRDHRRVQGDGLNHLTFMHLVDGEVAGEAGRLVHCQADETLVLDTGSTMDVTTTGNRNIGVRLPRNAFVGVGVDTEQLNGVVLSGAIGRVIGDHFAALVRHAFLVTAADAAVLERATVALLCECVREGRTAPMLLHVEARRRVADHIERYLADPELDGARISNATGLSRSVVYRAFPGGIGKYLSGRRLDRAFALLADPGDARGVADIALAVGFLDASHFSTTFRRRFGATASDVRRNGPGVAHNGLPDAYRLWLAALSA